MVKWLQTPPSRIPDYATHHVGVGGFVLNDNHEVLVVKDRGSVNKEWKLPGGFVVMVALKAEERYTLIIILVFVIRRMQFNIMTGSGF